MASALITIGAVVLYLRWKRIHRHFGNVPGTEDDWPFVRTVLTHIHLKRRSKNDSIDYNVLFFEYIVAGSWRMRRHPFFRTYMGDAPYVIIHKAEAAEAVLNNSTMVNKSAEYRLLNPWLGTGLLTSSGSKWRVRRKMLTPAFHFRILEDLLPVINEHSVIFQDVLSEIAEKEEVIDIAPLVARCTLDVICETAMGTKINALRCSDSKYVLAVKRLGELFLSRAAKPWLWPDIIYNLTLEAAEFKVCLDILHSFTRKVIKERKATLLKQHEMMTEHQENGTVGTGHNLSGQSRTAFLDLLLSQHFKDPSFTEEDIREEVDTFTFEGHDTTAVGISWALYMIGLHHHVQERIQTELENIFGTDTERNATMNDIRSMKYLECVLKESQRLFPSVPLIARLLQQDWKYDKYIMPKGTVCLVSIYSLHRDPDAFPNPEEFIPERFLPENCTGRHPFAYVPFSAGPRNCIGQRFAMMEMKTLVSRILRNFTLHSMDQRDKVQLAAELVLRPRDGLRIKLKCRKKT
ncbi:cytochrome P450 4c3 [Ixodes scapularis]|nr:cytochrome P450 4c3 [Ixodes scapularis]